MGRSMGAVRTACDIQIDGRRIPGRFSDNKEELAENNGRAWKLMTLRKEHIKILCVQLDSYLQVGAQVWMTPARY